MSDPTLPRDGTDLVQVRFLTLEQSYLKRVAEIVNQVVDILDSNGDPHEIRQAGPADLVTHGECLRATFDTAN